jgi:hypothetical protein
MLIFFHQEICINDLNIEFEELEPTESVDSAQAATASSHKEWLDAIVQNNLLNFLSFRRAVKTLRIYYTQGEPRKSDHQTYLIQICQIWNIAVQYISSNEVESNSSTQSQADFR